VKASGSTSVRIVQADLAKGLPFNAAFDLVFVDAPCSGLGTVRREPEIRWRRAEADLLPLAAAQLTMIHQAAAAVRPGGRLVYSTCSSEPEENEGVVDRFLAETQLFSAIDLRAEQPAHYGVIEHVLDERGFLRTAPHKHGLEAFFGAVLRRVE
jgi:16S rRNA (cytosine967-C5)-methyltransferase